MQEMVEDIFGTEHVRNSVSQFAPEELSVVAERTAKKVQSAQDTVIKRGSPTKKEQPQGNPSGKHVKPCVAAVLVVILAMLLIPAIMSGIEKRRMVSNERRFVEMQDEYAVHNYRKAEVVKPNETVPFQN